MKRVTIFFAWSVMALCTAVQGAALVVGGFSPTRVGDSSLSVGPFAEEMRAAIVDDYPGTTFVGIDTLSASSLNGVNYLIVGAPTFTTPVFLSSAEQTALRNYIMGGGAALIFIDNDTYAGVPTSDDSNETFLDPLGMDSIGRVPSRSNATANAPLHPVINGPAGSVVSIATNFGGWFENLGPNATGLAQYDANGMTAVAAIAPGALGPSSGGVVFIGDADALVDSADGGLYGAADNATFFRNAVAFSIVPEPSIGALWMGGGILLGLRRRKGRAKK
jgi:hypothetical protein